jgi:hypothetical protein
MNKYMHLWLIPLIVLSVLALFTSCSAKGATTAQSSATSTPTGQTSTPLTSTNPASPSSIQNILAVVQQTGNMSVSLSAIVSLQVSASTVSYPTVFAADQIPITWTGVNFNGRIEEQGPGEDLVDEAHGSLSADGNRVESMYFSRQVTRPSANSGTFFRVTLTQVPIVTIVNGAATKPGIFDQTSTNLQQYVTKIEYLDGPLVNGQISSLSTYVSTDWLNNNPGQTPSLKLTFANGKGTRSTIQGQ